MKDFKKDLIIIFITLFLLVIISGIMKLKNSESPNNKEQINSFQDCVSAGNAIMESYPEKCKTAGGRIFTRELNSTEKEKLKNNIY